MYQSEEPPNEYQETSTQKQTELGASQAILQLQSQLLLQNPQQKEPKSVKRSRAAALALMPGSAPTGGKFLQP